MKNIHVYGWYNKGNCGDEAYKLAFSKVFPNCNFTFTDLDSPLTSDTCIIGGGDIFNESYVNKALLAKKRYIISTGVNSLSPIDKIPYFDRVIVRDKDAYNKIRHFKNASYMPDIAVSLEPDKIKGVEIINNLANRVELYERKVGIIFNAYLLPNFNSLNRDFITFNNVSGQIVNAIDTTPASFVFIPMSVGMPYDDRISNGVIAHQCKFWKKNLFITDKLDVQETLNVISACDVVISSRLHSTIFSMLSEVPFIDITHHDKNRRYVDSMGMSDFSMAYWNFDSIAFKNKITHLFDNLSSYKDKMKNIKQKQKEMLTTVSNTISFE